MRVGSLGDIVFEVSEETFKTISNATWAGSARYAVHHRVGTDALTELTGIDPDTFSFDITLSAFHGIDIKSELMKIWTHERKGTSLPLNIGGGFYGKYRWTIQKHEIRLEKYVDGTLAECTVSISLLEYLWR